MRLNIPSLMCVSGDVDFDIDEFESWFLTTFGLGTREEVSHDECLPQMQDLEVPDMLIQILSLLVCCYLHSALPLCFDIASGPGEETANVTVRMEINSASGIARQIGSKIDQ